MSQFKDRLWSELVRSHGSDLARVTHPSARSRRRPRLLAGTGVGLTAVAGTAAAVVLGTAGTVPAFAVTKNHDGSVTVWVRRFTAIPAANARLQQLGYRARLVQVVAGCRGNRPWTGIHVGVLPLPRLRVEVHARFVPRQIPIGRVLVIPAQRRGEVLAVRPARLVRGQAPICLPPPLPVPVRGANPNGSYQLVAPGPLLAPCAPPPVPWRWRGRARHRQVPLPLPVWPGRIHNRSGRQQVRIHCPGQVRIHLRGRVHRHR